RTDREEQPGDLATDELVAFENDCVHLPASSTYHAVDRWKPRRSGPSSCSGKPRGACYDHDVRVPRGATFLVALLLVAGPAARADELFSSVATEKPRAELSQFLVKAADKAAKAHDLAHAIPLYQALA